MDGNFAGLCENVNNFSKDGIFASDRIERRLLRIDITLMNDCHGRKKRGEPVIIFDNLLPLFI
jgi:hypothetical protein